MEEKIRYKQKVYWGIVASIVVVVIIFAIYSDYRIKKLK